MSQATQLAINWVEQGLLPDTVVRSGIRRLCEQRLREIFSSNCEVASQQMEAFVRSMGASDIAPSPHLANEQHYEVPAEFFALVLGPHRKYSSAWWPEGTNSLAEAEAAALAATCERAELADEQSILELGCGWGSLTLWMARHYPRSRIVSVSNSHSQRDWILSEAARRGRASRHCSAPSAARWPTTRERSSGRSSSRRPARRSSRSPSAGRFLPRCCSALRAASTAT
jgi:cyclopropane-fatty-acyl-phospholipid synthase